MRVFFVVTAELMQSQESFIYEKYYKRWVAVLLYGVIMLVLSYLVWHEYQSCYAIAFEKHKKEVNVDRQICNPEARKGLPVYHIRGCDGEHLTILKNGPVMLAIKCTTDTFNIFTNGYISSTITSTINAVVGGTLGAIVVIVVIGGIAILSFFKYGGMINMFGKTKTNLERAWKMKRLGRMRAKHLLPTSVSATDNYERVLSRQLITATEDDNTAFFDGVDMQTDRKVTYARRNPILTHARKTSSDNDNNDNDNDGADIISTEYQNDNNPGTADGDDYDYDKTFRTLKTYIGADMRQRNSKTHVR